MQEVPIVSYPVQFSSFEIANTIKLLEEATQQVDRDLLIVSLLVMSLCLSDPELPHDDERFRNTLDSVGNHICWVLREGAQPQTDPKLMN